MYKIKNTFLRLKKDHKKALITFITAGYPNPTLNLPILNTLISSGSNIIEIGIPFSDPIAEGPLIQKACKISLKFNTNLFKIFNYILEFRKINKFTPIILMGYANTIEKFGLNKFIKYSKQSDIDGIIIVDYTPEECNNFTKKLKENKINQIFLISPTSTIERIKKISKISSGFSYYISLKGVTGSKNINIINVKKRINIIKKYIKLPIGVGFGINSTNIAKKISKFSDAIIIGSKIIKIIDQSNINNCIKNLKDFITKISKSINK